MKRNKTVGLGEVGSEVSSWNLIGDDEPLVGMPSLTAKMTGDGYALSCFPAAFNHVIGIHEQNSTVAVNASVAVMQAIDGCIVLVMASHGHQDILARFDGNIRQFMDGEMGLARWRGERLRVPGRIR